MDNTSIQPLQFRVTAIKYSISNPQNKQQIEANSSQDEEDKLMPPEVISRLAQLGIELYENYGGTQKFRLPQLLAQATPISISDIYEILNFFENNEFDKKDPGWKDRDNPSVDWIRWLMMGGDRSRSWARIVKRIRTAQIEIPN